MNEPTLHPNLAKLAAAYDEILERMARQQITTATARAEISQLEARDDQGIRWNIDPDSGQWVRKTALGDIEFDDAPPTYGYMTPDAFDYTQNPQVFNPSDRLQIAPVNEQLELAPTGLAGATRAVPSKGRHDALSKAVASVASAPTKVKGVAAGLALVLLTFLLYSCGGSAPAPSPDPKPTTATTHSPTKKAPAKKAPTKSAPKASAKASR